MRPMKGPWGGSSVFTSGLSEYLKRRGYSVLYTLNKPVDVIILVDPRDWENTTISMKQIIQYKKTNPDVRVLHRVNECDQRKSTDFMNDMLAEANQSADYTVFISKWLQDYHAKRWFKQLDRCADIYNGADTCEYHPIGSAQYNGDTPFRIVTHHWSNNPLKGFDVYREVDRMIAENQLPGVELWVIGRWPNDIKWRSAKTFPPTKGKYLAAMLRQCHAYITASVWEPCGMHHVEGAQCGLPLIYHADGGGIVEAGEKYGIAFKDDVKSAIYQMRDEYSKYRALLFDNMPSGDRMCLEYTEAIQRLVCKR